MKATVAELRQDKGDKLQKRLEDAKWEDEGRDWEKERKRGKKERKKEEEEDRTSEQVEAICWMWRQVEVLFSTL